MNRIASFSFLSVWTVWYYSYAAVVNGRLLVMDLWEAVSSGGFKGVGQRFPIGSGLFSESRLFLCKMHIVPCVHLR